MLYPDSARRIADVNKIADLFSEKGYQRTSEEILSFAEILREKQIPSDFLKRLDSLFNLFQKEFAARLPIGQDYRKECFGEIKETVLKAIRRIGVVAYSQALLVILPLLKRLNHTRRITGEIGEALAKKRISDKNVIFHLYCYTYLIVVEGMFGELARMLYFLGTLSKNNIPSAQDLETMTVWDVLKEVKPTPVFLKDWEEKKHIRNAIGHAQAYLDPVKNEIRLLDTKIVKNKKTKSKTVKITYDRTLSMNEFMEKALELESSVMAFFYTFVLLKIYDFIASQNPYQ